MVYMMLFPATIACLLIGYHALRLQRRRKLAFSNGCQPPNTYPHKDPILGLDFFLNTANAIRKNRLLPELTRRYMTLGHTFQSISLGTSSISSAEPENVKAVFSSRFDDWGVEPWRLPALMPACGRGFLTTDGAAWEYSKGLLSPSFHKSSAVALPSLESHLKKLIDQIPRDGSTIDLQPLLYKLVSILGCVAIGSSHTKSITFSIWTQPRSSFGANLSIPSLETLRLRHSISWKHSTTSC